MRNTVSVLICLFTSNAIASSNYCVKEYITKVDSIRTVVSDCKALGDSKLSSHRSFYPKMNRYYTVQIWLAGFERVIETTPWYVKELVDACGRYPRLISQVEYRGKPTTKVNKFWVENPNLSDEVDASFKLSPMTESELIAEMENAKQRCEEFELN